MLATNLVATLPIVQLERLLRSTEFIKQLIIQEVQEHEPATPFVDCVTDLSHRNHTRVAYKQAQTEFAMFLYHQLDIPRLKAEVRQYLLDLGITTDDLEKLVNNDNLKEERNSNDN